VTAGGCIGGCLSSRIMAISSSAMRRRSSLRADSSRFDVDGLLVAPLLRQQRAMTHWHAAVRSSGGGHVERFVALRRLPSHLS